MKPRRKVSKLQMEIIVETMEANKNLASNQVNKFYTVAQKAADWNMLALKLNQVGQAVKSTNKWQKCWVDFKCEVKKKVHYNSKQMLEGDGSNVHLRQITPLDRRVLVLLGINVPENQLAEGSCSLRLTSIMMPESTETITPAHIVDFISVAPLSETIVPKPENTMEYLSDERPETNLTSVGSPTTTILPEPLETNASFHTDGPSTIETDSAPPRNTTSNRNPSKEVPKLIRSRSTVINEENSRGLIAAEEATAAAIRTVSAAIEKLAEAETRKAVALEKFIQHFWG